MWQLAIRSVLGLGDRAGCGEGGGVGGGEGGGMKATLWIARKIWRDINCFELLNTLADFDCKWGV